MSVKRIIQGALGLLMMASAATATAGPIELRLSSGGSVVTVTDGGALHAHPMLGIITYIGSIGGFSINVSTVLGDAITRQPGLNFGEEPIVLFGATGGTTGAKVAHQLYADATSSMHGTGSLIVEGTSAGAAFAETASSVFTPSSPLSIYQRVTLTHALPTVSSFDFEARIPEPSSVALLGIGLLGIAVPSRRKSN